MEPVIIRNVSLGEGRPKICVPIVGVSRDDIISEAEALSRLPVDVVEWRADWFDEIFKLSRAVEIARTLRSVLVDTPLLFTFRTSREGGQKAVTEEVYRSLNMEMVKSGYVDLIDIELFMGDKGYVKGIINEAHHYGVKVIVSNHDFQKTPPKSELVARLRHMSELGADVPKIAVMPQNRGDVLALLGATLEASDKCDCPIITMSMSGMGVISRLAGECFGSALTFGAASKASAPGQPDVRELARALDIIHSSTI